MNVRSRAGKVLAFDRTPEVLLHILAEDGTGIVDEVCDVK